ncbi:hypothetical protein RND71_003674 [Anisodus tanguticus]|uniref:Uncharacterized protein n=1 Tax=Anisodus tanguticus TaxID=243964 RepID=A0AAE1VNX5_9SOLA|nr:hypothetical protein RND71_003674 [Anisodus tanguticus]
MEQKGMRDRAIGHKNAQTRQNHWKGCTICARSRSDMSGKGCVIAHLGTRTRRQGRIARRTIDYQKDYNSETSIWLEIIKVHPFLSLRTSNQEEGLLDPSPPSNVVDIEPDQPYNNDKEYCSTDEEDDGETRESTPDEQKYLSRRRTINMNNPPDDTNNSNNTYYTPKNGLSDNNQVLRCTSFQRRASMLGRVKTKSRLIDRRDT